jgi:hypothetical protein
VALVDPAGAESARRLSRRRALATFLSTVRYQGVLPQRFFADPLGYADALRAASPSAA